MDFAQQLVNGVQIGSVYALVAIGYTMVYGIAKMINFAHGDIIMVGSYVALLFFQSSGLPVWGVIAATAAVSAVIALAIGIAAALLGPKVDAALSWCMDLVMGIPHILLVLVISLAFGRGFTGVVAGVALSHWPSLSRVIRGEVLQLRQAAYVRAAEKLGVPRRRVVRRHILPHLLPQFLTGLILQFPHAILHEASVTFLGFGLSPEQPAIGVILSESMRYLTTGKWWLALFPGLALVLVVLLFAGMGERLRRLLDPASVHQ